MATQVGPLTITRLFSAVKTGQLNGVEESLKQYGIPRSGPKTTDYLILQTALQNKQREIAKCLINAGCRVQAKPTDNGLTPLAIAFIQEDQEIALMILKRGSTIHVDNTNGSTVLHLAVQKKSLKMLRFIFITNINVDILDQFGKTALQTLFENHPKSNNQADEMNKLEMIRFLLIKGASVNFKSGNGKTPLHYVVELKQEDITKCVLQKISDMIHVNYVNAQDNQGQTALHILLNSYESENEIFEIVKLFIDKGANVNIADLHKVTVCHIAAGKKFFQILNKFLQCQCIVSLQDSNGDTILHRMLKNSAHLSNDEVYVYFFNAILAMAPLENVKNSLGKTLVHLAAENYHYKILEKMLPKFTNINETDNHGDSLLHILLRNVSNANYGIIQNLLSAGANVDMKNADGKTPVDLVSKIGNKNLMLLILQHSKYPNQYKFLLHYLSDLKINSPNEELEMTKFAKTCIEKGIHVDVLDDLSRTPLLVAVMNQCKYMVRVLLEHGANPNFGAPQTTIIERLVEKPSLSSIDIEIADMLISKGAGTFITFKGLLSLLKYIDIQEKSMLVMKLLDKCENLHAVDSSGNTILHAVLNSNVNTSKADEEKIIKIVNLFLAKGVPIDLKNEEGITALHLAAKNKHSSVCGLLLKNGANASELDSKGNSALHYVSMLKAEIDAKVEKSIIDLLVLKGCNVNAKNNTNMTPLMTAARFGCLNAMKALISRGANVDCTFGNYLSKPLHVAAEYNHFNIVEYLLECGADVYEKRKDGKTAVHVAAVCGKLETLQVLLKRWTDPDARDCNGRTALHWACWHGHLLIVKQLLICGADVNAVDKLGVTPLMLSQNSNNQVWSKLQKHVAILATAGISIPRQSIACINNYKKRVDTSSVVSHAQVEVLKMQQILIDDNTTLADVLKVKLNKLTGLRDNVAFKNLMNAEDFNSTFPLYGQIIKSCYARGIIRYNLSKIATKVLRRVIGSALRDECAERILTFLDNENLIDLIQAAGLKMKMKRKVCIEAGGGNSSKRVRCA